MAETMRRIIKAREDAVEAAKIGAPTPGKGKPGKNDVIVDPKHSGSGKW